MRTIVIIRKSALHRGPRPRPNLRVRRYCIHKHSLTFVFRGIHLTPFRTSAGDNPEPRNSQNEPPSRPPNVGFCGVPLAGRNLGRCMVLHGFGRGLFVVSGLSGLPQAAGGPRPGHRRPPSPARTFVLDWRPWPAALPSPTGGLRFSVLAFARGRGSVPADFHAHFHTSTRTDQRAAFFVRRKPPNPAEPPALEGQGQGAIGRNASAASYDAL